MELVEKLESQVAAVREQKSENVSYLEKENLELHVENRELKKQLESVAAQPEKDDVTGDTGTYDASAAAAAKVLGEDNAGAANDSEVTVTGDGTDSTAESPSKQEAGATRASGFLLSTTELDAIAAESQEEPNDGERLECPLQ
ncbi:hypothetical protein PHYPSEUDO_012626 [Phytophthora pseudosyringae]|uniref:Uncharacterized protein n=1 Tax=Phytophthora pseudosyringae TaxID=221518 RepID=A0A8T1W6T9_9STRA|nr:hypothetical protein PHYPSEUDO_012626 [Phytophthora pseudosyringae]